MNILFASSEAAPFFKTGGLGDVAGALPGALARLGHDVRLVLPRYRAIDTQAHGIVPLLPEMLVDVEAQTVSGAIDFAPGDVPVYFVRNDRYFDRAGAYCEIVAGELRDYSDNLERFGFFCMAVIWMLKGLGWRPDIIHCNDWQTALIPVYLETNPIVANDPFYHDIKTVFSIHNLAFQGVGADTMLPRIGGGLDAFSIPEIAWGHGVNAMRGAVLLADELTTVSKRYVDEIQTAELGCGLEKELTSRADRLTGIVNGLDVDDWNPATDPHIAANYTPGEMSGKATCKRALQEEFRLPVRSRAPVFGVITRLTAQKGVELIDACVARMAEHGAQVVVLGDGEPRYHRMMERMRAKYPENVSVRLGFDVPCSHRVVAGADLYLMPSYYEPCGLNQMIAMRYGAPPVVRRTGGLADTVTDGATGFVFDAFTPRAMTRAVERAMALYAGDSDTWRRLCRTGMGRDFSWNGVAREYVNVYQRAF